MKITTFKHVLFSIIALLSTLIYCNNPNESWIKYKLININYNNDNSFNKKFEINNWFIDLASYFEDKPKEVPEIKELDTYSEIPTENSFYLIFSEDKIKIYDFKNIKNRKLIISIDIGDIFYNELEKNSNFQENKDCFSFFFQNKQKLTSALNLDNIIICTIEKNNSNNLQTIIFSIEEKLEFLNAKSESSKIFENIHFKSTEKKIKSEQFQLLNPYNIHPNPIMTIAPGVYQTSSLSVPGSNMINIINFPAAITDIRTIFPKKIDCVLKEGYLNFNRKIISQKTNKTSLVKGIEKTENFVPVRIKMTIDNISVFLIDMTEVVNLVLSEVLSVKKNKKNPKCFVITNSKKNKFKFCMLENTFETSCDDWVNDIMNFKNKCNKKSNELKSENETKFNSTNADKVKKSKKINNTIKNFTFISNSSLSKREENGSKSKVSENSGKNSLNEKGNKKHSSVYKKDSKKKINKNNTNLNNNPNHNKGFKGKKNNISTNKNLNSPKNDNIKKITNPKYDKNTNKTKENSVNKKLITTSPSKNTDDSKNNSNKGNKNATDFKLTININLKKNNFSEYKIKNTTNPKKRKTELIPSFRSKDEDEENPQKNEKINKKKINITISKVNSKINKDLVKKNNGKTDSQINDYTLNKDKSLSRLDSEENYISNNFLLKKEKVFEKKNQVFKNSTNFNIKKEENEQPIKFNLNPFTNRLMNNGYSTSLNLFLEKKNI